MPPARRSSPYSRTALALVAMLIGVLFSVSGMLQHISVFAAIAESVTNVDPILSPLQTLAVGVVFVAVGAVWARRERPRD
jgi:putative exporter of polyketide antibiotics